MYDRLENSSATSWNQIEDEFLSAMSQYDSGLPMALEGDDENNKTQNKELNAAIKNGKRD